MESKRLQGDIKKGPWTAEEDEILMKFVKENNPRGWSSIRANGLLPRTGKSCRLRWVNKLRPNLKIGCKFSAEEERVVLDLQATFGNKWATIATYLPGRTDNDVKNFWSTRQKRLARILRSSSQSNRPQKHQSKVSPLHQASSSQSLKSWSDMTMEEASLKCELCSCFCTENSNTTNNIVPQASCFNPFMPVSIPSLPPPVDAEATAPLAIKEKGTKPPIASPWPVSFGPPQPIQETDLMEFGAPNYMELLACQESFHVENQEMINFGLSKHEIEATERVYDGGEKDTIAVIDDNLFGDLPVDWFDLPEAVPGSSAY